MKTHQYILSVAAAATVALATHATAAELSHADRQFFEKAAKSGMKEVSVSEAVQPKLTTPAAKDFAQMMTSDHTKANEELQALAASKGVTLPAADPKPAQKWAKKDKDKDLDEDYLEEMVSDHKDAVEL